MRFFFSSRRRHTRSLCDWSSDVCSSDLVAAETVLISMVCRPLTKRCVPVTFTLLSAKGSSFEFCGSPGFELTGKYIVPSLESSPSGTPALAQAWAHALWPGPDAPFVVLQFKSTT